MSIETQQSCALAACYLVNSDVAGKKV